jgi:hypothetical protein
VISDRDIWQAAVLVVKRYSSDALLEASERAEKLPDEGDLIRAEVPEHHNGHGRDATSSRAGSPNRGTTSLTAQSIESSVAALKTSHQCGFPH